MVAKCKEAGEQSSVAARMGCCACGMQHVLCGGARCAECTRRWLRRGGLQRDAVTCAARAMQRNMLDTHLARRNARQARGSSSASGALRTRPTTCSCPTSCPPSAGWAASKSSCSRWRRARASCRASRCAAAVRSSRARKSARPAGARRRAAPRTHARRHENARNARARARVPPRCLLRRCRSSRPTSWALQSLCARWGWLELAARVACFPPGPVMQAACMQSACMHACMHCVGRCARLHETCDPARQLTPRVLSLPVLRIVLAPCACACARHRTRRWATAPPRTSRSSSRAAPTSRPSRSGCAHAAA